MSEKRDSWSGHLAFILAGAASAIGLGNLWRFPYLAAQYGGGCFIVAYLSLALTLGCTLLITEVAIGRISRQSQITAFSKLSGKKWWWIGAISTLVPFLISPYYAVIGGWVIKYFVYYAKASFTGAAPMSNPSAYFDAFVSSGAEPVIYMVLFILITILIILCGVKNGIEKANAVMMPTLFITAIVLSIYIAFLPGAVDGIKFYLIPDFSRCDNICKLFLGAMGQMFFSLSLAMGIMVTYGSYMKSDSSIPHAAVRIAFADTIVAVLSGFMVIPVVYSFAVSKGLNPEVALKAGPGLLFKSLPEVFSTFGLAGNFLALAFFLLVFFAAATSAISMSEACVAAICDYFHWNRKKAAISFGAFCVAVGSVSAIDMKALNFTDAIVNSLFMPITALSIAIFAGWVYGADKLLDNVAGQGNEFKYKPFLKASLKYFVPVLVSVIFISEICRALGVFSI